MAMTRLDFEYRFDRLLTVLALAFFSGSVSAELVQLKFEGDAKVIGYPGLSYYAQHYEPICGNLGYGEMFKGAVDMGHTCSPAIDAFLTDGSGPVAKYSTTGVLQENTLVGTGDPLCMCFALAAIDPDRPKGALCLYVNGVGQAQDWWSLALDDTLKGNFRIGVDKSLPICENVDLDNLAQSWSATAISTPTSQATTSCK
jgi:hypothetical protein